SSNAHKAIRQMLVEEQRLDGIVSMPSGVFKPYAGVSTAVLLFTRTDSGGTDSVWFYDMKSDGLSLDDKRNPVATNDLPDVVARWTDRGSDTEKARLRTEQSFHVPVSEIRANGFDLSINRYKEVVHAQVAHESPQTILVGLASLEAEIAAGLKELEEMLASK
ncbi:MAG: DNA methyltransferase, partial [Proteobacteria bacterium]